MRLSKSAQYALHAAVEMAVAGEAPVTVGQVAGPHRIPQTALAKVFQQLVRAGIAVGTRGVGGGYRLARPRAEITVLDVVSVFDPLQPLAGAAPSARTPHAAALQRLVAEVDEGIRATLGSVTLDTLVRYSESSPR
jgi:Rrf2 family transcriptional regulator, nitric oxide-sensitive transcriptional repressor